jgi:MFS family permease
VSGGGPATDAAAARVVARDAVLLAVGAGAALSALSWGEPLIAVGLGAAGVAIAIGPLRRLLPAGSLTARSARGATIAVLGLVSIAFFGVEAFVPLVVASVRNAGTVAGGLALTAATVTWAAGSWLQARLAARVSRRLVIGAGLGLIGVGIAIEAVVPLSAIAPIWLAMVGWAVASLGMGLAYSTLVLTVIELAPSGGEGSATAAAQLANTIGIAIGTGVTGGIVAVAASGSLGLAPGIVIADLLMLAIVLVGVAATREIPRRRPDQPAPPAAAAAAEHGPTLGP